MMEENQWFRDRVGIMFIGVIVIDGGFIDLYRLEDVVRQVYDKRIEMYVIGKFLIIFFKYLIQSFIKK